MRGHSPELDAPEARQMLGRSLARIHQIGALRAFQVRPGISVQRLGWDARAQVLASELLPQALRERYSSVSGALLERVSEAFAAAAGTREIRLHGDCHLGIFCGTSTARCSWTWMIAPRGYACRTCG